MLSVETLGGIPPPGEKHLSEKCWIEQLPLPKRVLIPLNQNLGAPCEPVVKAKEAVKAGQVVGKPTGFVSAPVHASISGTVKSVGYHATSTAPRSLCVEIISDEKDEWIEGIGGEDGPVEKVDTSDPAAMLQAIKEAGLVGMGGASFPTHVKLTPPDDVNIDTFLLNGVECEPYLTADHRLMLEHADKIVQGLLIMKAIVKAPRARIGIEDNKPDAIETMTRAVQGMDDIEVVPLKTLYPQGAEKQLIKAVLNREVPSGKLPMQVGAVVQNVGTAFAAYEAVQKKKPLVERIVTISGRAVENPKNLRVRVGTSLLDLVEFCGGSKEDLTKIVFGGPMMGKAIRFEDLPVLKSTSGVLLLNRKEAGLVEETACIRCGRCMDACPQGLLPAELSRAIEARRFDLVADVSDCIECGSCQFACPAHRRLVHVMRLGKNEQRKLANKDS